MWGGDFVDLVFFHVMIQGLMVYNLIHRNFHNLPDCSFRPTLLWDVGKRPLHFHPSIPDRRCRNLGIYDM